MELVSCVYTTTVLSWVYTVQKPAPGKDGNSYIHLRSKVMKWERIIFCELLILDSCFHQLQIFTTRIKYSRVSSSFFLHLWNSMHPSRGRIQRKTWCMGPYARVDYITSPYVHSRVDCNTFIGGNPMPESTLILGQSRLYPQVRDFGFSLSSTVWKWVTKYWK